MGKAFVSGHLSFDFAVEMEGLSCLIMGWYAIDKQKEARACSFPFVGEADCWCLRTQKAFANGKERQRVCTCLAKPVRSKEVGTACAMPTVSYGQWQL